MGKQLKTNDEKILKVAREKENVLSLQNQGGGWEPTQVSFQQKDRR